MKLVRGLDLGLGMSTLASGLLQNEMYKSCVGQFRSEIASTSRL